IHQAAEGPFAGILKIAGDGVAVVALYSRIRAEGALKCVDSGNYGQRRDGDGSRATKLDWKMHRATLNILRGLRRIVWRGEAEARARFAACYGFEHDIARFHFPPFVPGIGS